MQSDIKPPLSTLTYFHFHLYRNEYIPLKKVTVEICAKKEVHSRNKIKAYHESNANPKTFIIQTDSSSLNEERKSNPKPYFTNETLDFKGLASLLQQKQQEQPALSLFQTKQNATKDVRR